MGLKDYIFCHWCKWYRKNYAWHKGFLRIIKTTFIEQNMIPEFISRDGIESMTGELEELTCWENMVAMLKCFHKLGYKGIIVTDMDDLRTAVFPLYLRVRIISQLSLVSSDLEQIREQMKNRPNNGLIDYELQQKTNDKNLKRDPLVNEVEIDVSGKSIEEVLNEAIEIIDTTESLLDYECVKPPKELFYSWVFANGLR